MKTCRKCGIEKELSAFSKNKGRKDGLQSWCKLCTNENSRKRREENPEYNKEYGRKWREKNPEKQREKNRKWAEENPEKRREINRKWQKENPEKAKENSRKWSRKNSEGRREFQRNWHKENPEKRKGYAQKRRALKKNCEINDFTADQWIQLKEEYNYCCAYCGKYSEILEIEHVIPLSRGGNHTLENIVPSCRSCNGRKNNKTPEEAGMTFFDFDSE